MNRRLLTAWVILGLLQFCYAQKPVFEWAKSIEVSFGFGQRSIACDVKGNVYTVGFFQDSVDFGTASNHNIIHSIGKNDIFISKFDAAGRLIWVKSMGSIDNDYGFSIALDGSGNIYTTGFFEGTADFDPSNRIYELTSAGLLDIFILKLDSNGNFLWAKSMGGENNEMAYSICTDAIGNIYTTGWFSGIADFNPEREVNTLTSVGLTDVFIQKLDSSGNFLWAKSMGGDGSDESFSIAVDGVGSVYTTGWFYSSVDFDPSEKTNILNSRGETDIFIQKFNTKGELLWAKTVGGDKSDYGYSICIDKSNNAYITGFFNNSMDFDPSPNTNILTSFGGTDFFVLKLDNSGNYLWAKSMGGTSSDFASSIAIDMADNVYTAGFFRNTVDFDPNIGISNLSSNGIWDIFLQKMDKNGNFLWAKSIGGSDNDKAYAVCVDSSANIYTSGFFEGTVDFDPDLGVYNLIGTSKGFVLKMNQRNATAIKNISNDEKISIFPNPSEHSFSIDLGYSYKNLSLKILDLFGRVIYTQQVDNRFITPNINLSKGVYFIYLYQNNKIKYEKIVIQ